MMNPTRRNARPPWRSWGSGPAPLPAALKQTTFVPSCGFLRGHAGSTAKSLIAVLVIAGLVTAACSSANRHARASKSPSLLPPSSASVGTNTSTPPPSAAEPASPNPSSHIVFAYTTSSDPAKIVASLPSYVQGVSWLFPWREIEPSQDTFNWAPINNAIAAAAATGRTSMIRVFAGQFGPHGYSPG